MVGLSGVQLLRLARISRVIVRLVIIHFRERITIACSSELQGCVGLYVPLLVACNKIRFSHVNGQPPLEIPKRSEYPDEMQQNAIFHQGLHCLLRQNRSSEKEI